MNLPESLVPSAWSKAGRKSAMRAINPRSVAEILSEALAAVLYKEFLAARKDYLRECRSLDSRRVELAEHHAEQKGYLAAALSQRQTLHEDMRLAMANACEGYLLCDAAWRGAFQANFGRRIDLPAGTPVIPDELLEKLPDPLA